MQLINVTYRNKVWISTLRQNTSTINVIMQWSFPLQYLPLFTWYKLSLSYCQHCVRGIINTWMHEWEHFSYIYLVRYTITKLYLSLFLPPNSLLILSNTVLRGSCNLGLFPFNESCETTWIIAQSMIFLSLSFLCHSVMLSLTEFLYSSASYR